MKIHVSLSLACMLLSVTLIPAAIAGETREMRVAQAETLCGGAYDCTTMRGTCCCLCGMNYGCVDRGECEQNPGCTCRKPTPEPIEGEKNWPKQQAPEEEGP